MLYGERGLEEPGTAPESFYTNEFFVTVPRLPVPRLLPRGSLGTPKILGTGATLHLGPIRLHVENLERRAKKWSARCQKCAVPCRFFSACKWGLIFSLFGRSSRSTREIVPLDKWEILPEQIEYEEELGRGAFGVVYKAALKRRVGIELFGNEKILKPDEPCQVVAVKVLQGRLQYYSESCIRDNSV